jgi:hypothetical protein
MVEVCTMFSSLLALDLPDAAALTAQRSRRIAARVRPSESALRIESLETRTLFCGAPGMTVEEAANFVGPVQHMHESSVAMAAQPGGQAALDARPAPSIGQLVPLVITGVVRIGNELVAQGLMGEQPFSAPLALTATFNPAQPDCPILNLELGPIHLDLLGLVVDTSRICLDIVADPNGGLLGQLLCGISNLLNNGIPLGTILDNLGANLNDVLTGLTNVLDNVFDRLTDATALVGVSGTGGGADAFNNTCDILNLAIGPIDLNLLGLEVHLDNCHNGPVTLDITAEEGPGNLLGNLLCGLSNLLNNQGPPRQINALLRQIRDVINGLV